jgi:hypothetical protein
MSAKQHMTEQTAWKPIPKRASATTEERFVQGTPPSRQQSSSTHRTGFHAGIHDESVPHQSTDVQARHHTMQAGYDEAEVDDGLYENRFPRSQRRYRPLPATTVKEVQPQSGVSFSRFLVVVGFVLCIGVFIAFLLVSAVFPALTNWNNDRLYGYPRLFRTEANVGHGTAQYPTSRFIGINNSGVLEVMEIPKGNLSAKNETHLYVITRLVGANADLIPITDMSFVDVNGDGKLDMEVTVHNTLYILLNTGTSFTLQH